MCSIDRCGTDDRSGSVPRPTPEARRAFLKGVAGLPLAMVLADTALAQAAAAGLRPVTIRTAQGGTAGGVLALPKTTPAPAVVLIHEWWGLNDQIKAVAAEFAANGFVALAVDLFDGQVATTAEQARGLIGAMDVGAATDALASWIRWLKNHAEVNGSVGTVGWCFGGGWSLRAAIAAPVEATVIYYGRVDRPVGELTQLKGPVLGHFATEDRFINPRMVGDFEQAMMAAGKSDLTVNWYVADHAFANPSGARYDAEDAALSWARTLAFFHRYLD